MQQMPVYKQLAYAFNAAAEKLFGTPAALCTQMIEIVTDSGMKSPFAPQGAEDRVGRYRFIWGEARPVPGKTDQYTIHQCHYARNGIPFMPMFPTYSEMQIHATSGPTAYFTREEAETILKGTEEGWAKQGYDIPDQPLALRLMNFRHS